MRSYVISRVIPVVVAASVAAGAFSVLPADAVTGHTGAATKADRTVDRTVDRAVEKAATKAAADVKFLSYNVRSNFRRVDGRLTEFPKSHKRHWEKREGRVVDLIARANTEVVALQETRPYGNNKRPARRIVKALRARGETYALATPSNTNRAILYDTSALKLLDDGYVSGPGTNPARWAKFADRARGTTFYVANLHLSATHNGHSYGSRESELQRTREAKAVYREMARLTSSGDRVVYLGDFNTYRGRKIGNVGDGAGAYLRSKKIAETGRRSDGRLACGNKCVNYAYNTLNGFLPRGSRKNGNHVDRMFVSRTWSKTLQWKVVLVADGVSDHYPIKVWMDY